MAEILAIRHSRWKYVPNAREQELSPEGVKLARSLAPKIGKFDRAFSSEYSRAKQTVSLLGYSNYKIEPNLNEIFCPENFGTAAEYTRHMFHHHLEEVRAKAAALQTFVRSLPPNSRTLLISHGVTLTALYVKLQHGGIESEDWNLVEFEPLTGFYVRVKNGKVTSVKMFQS